MGFHYFKYHFNTAAGKWHYSCHLQLISVAEFVFFLLFFFFNLNLFGKQTLKRENFKIVNCTTNLIRFWMNCSINKMVIWRQLQLIRKTRKYNLFQSLMESEFKSSIACLSFYKNNGEQKRYYNRTYSTRKSWEKVLIGAATLASIGCIAYCKNLSPVEAAESSQVSNDLPTYTANDIRLHDVKEKRIWISYKSGVYDITDFVDKHPGGEIILMAAGGSLEPFWMLYQIHQNKTILDLLETFRIGNLAVEDQGQATVDLEDPYAQEPIRHPALQPSSVKPFNAEPPLQFLSANYTTPNELFYVRNHLPVPNISAETYELEISGEGMNPIMLSLKDLKTKFKKYTITAAIQCAGNRRSEMIKLKPIKGLNWNAGAIGNATWSGARLVDVLMYAAGSDPKNFISSKHIHFEGYDIDATGVPYGASIPLHKALDPRGDVLLAYEMNNEPLPIDHGFPVRVIVPGVVGARNVKWLNRIVISSEESSSHWQQNDYKGFPPHIDWDTVDFKSAPAIQELPVQSAICEPTEGTVLKRDKDTVTIKGYAWSGGGRGIVRVDVSIDGGKSWNVAELEPAQMKLHRAWAWTLWKINMAIPKDINEMDICCRAVDSSYNIQPELVAPIWNLRGVLNNAWHHVHVQVS